MVNCACGYTNKHNLKPTKTFDGRQYCLMPVGSGTLMIVLFLSDKKPQGILIQINIPTS